MWRCSWQIMWRWFFFLNLTTEAHCELSIVEYKQVATTKGMTSAPMQGDGSRNLGAFTCDLVANWVTQNLNRGFSRSLCWDLTFTTSTNNQNISNPGCSSPWKTISCLTVCTSPQEFAEKQSGTGRKRDSDIYQTGSTGLIQFMFI